MSWKTFLRRVDEGETFLKLLLGMRFCTVS
jgi:hypothetical protein